jgi:hypothetical protein
MNTYNTVLFLHLLFLFIGIGASAILGLCLFQLRAARTLEEAVPWGRVAGPTPRAFPIALLGLFATGAYMTTDQWTWSAGWIQVSIAGLVVLAVQGGVVDAKLGKRLERALHENGPGPLRGDALRMTRYFPLWAADLSGICLVFGIVWNMTHKPGTGGAVAAVVIAYAVGVALGFFCTRGVPAEDAPPAREPV